MSNEAKPHVLYQCQEGHMVTPSALIIMELHDIACPMCDAHFTDFEVVPVDELPKTSEEYGIKVIEADEVILYNRKEEDDNV